MSADAAAFPNREAVADKLAALAEADQAYLRLLMETPQQDENLLEGLDLCLNRAAEARFLNTLKLEKLGEWLGNTAPGDGARYHGRGFVQLTWKVNYAAMSAHLSKVTGAAVDLVMARARVDQVAALARCQPVIATDKGVIAVMAAEE